MQENVEETLSELGLPIEARIPNKATRAPLADAKKRRNLATHGSTDALFVDLGI